MQQRRGKDEINIQIFAQLKIYKSSPVEYKKRGTHKSNKQFLCESEN